STTQDFAHGTVCYGNRVQYEGVLAVERECDQQTIGRPGGATLIGRKSVGNPCQQPVIAAVPIRNPDFRSAIYQDGSGESELATIRRETDSRGDLIEQLSRYTPYEGHNEQSRVPGCCFESVRDVNVVTIR